jgi:hypothetical protein
MQYYALISGLPDISLDDTKSLYTVKLFKEELDGILSNSDKKLINSLFLKYDNDNLLTYLKDKDAIFNPNGNISHEEMADIVLEIREVEKPSNKKTPSYFIEFVVDYYSGTDALNKLFWEDQLSSLYYDYLFNSTNIFIKKWSELNLNINNILIALACRKNGIAHAPYIIGNNEVANTIRTSNARDFGISEIFEQYDEVKRIDEETNILEKERRIDQLKWNWIDEENFFKYFSVEKVIGFLLKLQMLERWISLDELSGKQIFVNLVGNLKKNTLNKKSS